MALMIREYLKVVLLGENMTGKTCLVKRYFKNEFSIVEKTTIGGACESKVFAVDGREYQMIVWDTTGDERYRSICRLYYRSAAAAILCYDVRLPSSFQHLNYWINQLRKVEPTCRLYICATKADLLDEFEANPSINTVQQYAADWNAKFFLTSSKTGVNIERVFEEILEDYMSDFRHTPKTSTIKLSNNNRLFRNKEKKCCADG